MFRPVWEVGLLSELRGDTPIRRYLDLRMNLDLLMKESYEHMIELLMCDVRQKEVCCQLRFAKEDREWDRYIRLSEEGRQISMPQVTPEEHRRLILNAITWKYDWIQQNKKQCYQFAEAVTLTKLSKRTYLGNLKWTASGVAASMRNERYCGDVLTRKRFTKFAADVHDQKSFKNRGEKPQSHYLDDHEAIIDRNDFLAVQRIMDNAKFGGTSLLPELQVIPDGLLKGFVIVHPKWGSFTIRLFTLWMRTNREKSGGC